MTDNTPQKVDIDDADIHSLRQAAQLLGIEITPTMNGNVLRSKIKAADASVEEIDVFIPEGPGAPRNGAKAANEGAAKSSGGVQANGVSLDKMTKASDPLHHSNDPKVKLRIFKTDDKRRSRVVDVSVNGVTFRIQRDQEVVVPYRVYEALDHAQEDTAVDGSEINPRTGDPIKEWTKVHSYPFQILGMPSEEEVIAWRETTDRLFQKQAAA